MQVKLLEAKREVLQYVDTQTGNAVQEKGKTEPGYCFNNKVKLLY